MEDPILEQRETIRELREEIEGLRRVRDLLTRWLVTEKHKPEFIEAVIADVMKKPS